MTTPPVTTKPLLLGHRGAAGSSPENTMRAFQLALAQGADGLETDVQRTSDGVLVLIHDDDLDRTTNGHGKVGAQTYSTIAALDAGDGERVPTLDDLLHWGLRQPTVPFLNLELKMPGTGPDTLAALARCQYPASRVALSSFDYPSLEQARQADPTVELWLLSVFYHDGLLDQARAINATCLDLRHPAITPDVCTQVAAAGLGLVSWTVNDPATITRLLACTPPLRALIGDFPERLVQGAQE